MKRRPDVIVIQAKCILKEEFDSKVKGYENLIELKIFLPNYLKLILKRLENMESKLHGVQHCSRYFMLLLSLNLFFISELHCILDL